MGEDQYQRTARQERLGRTALPRLNKLADELETVTAEVFEQRVSYTPEHGADVMALSFVAKQSEHLRSVRALIRISAHRDALLIARTMLEGLGRLLWAFNRRPERTDLWLWYGAILDWRRTLRNEQAGMIVDAREKAELKRYVDQHGPNYYREKVRKAIDDARSRGLDYQGQRTLGGESGLPPTWRSCLTRLAASRYMTGFTEIRPSGFAGAPGNSASNAICRMEYGWLH